MNLSSNSDYASYQQTGKREMVNPSIEGLNESPCLRCPERRKPGWISSKCAQTCKIFNPLGVTFSCPNGVPQKECPFEDCHNIVNEGTDACQSCRSKFQHRKNVLKIPPNLIYQKECAPIGTYDPYDWPIKRRRRKKLTE